MVDCNYFREKTKHCTLKKKLFPTINYSNLKGKNVLQEQLLYCGLQSFIMSCYFTKMFVSLLVIAAGCYFSVYKLIGWDPARICLFKVNSKNTKTWSDVCPKLPINAVESRSGVFIVNFENYSHFFSVFL